MTGRVAYRPAAGSFQYTILASDGRTLGTDSFTLPGATRLRPILMTSITVIAGNIPTALGLGDGAELRRGLGMAVIGGMITSTLLRLVLVPAAYSLLDAAQTRFGQLFQRQAAQADAPAPAQTAGSHAEAR